MSNRLSRRTKFLYGIGDTGFSLTSTILGAYFAIFLIDVLGISPGVAVVLFAEMGKRAKARGFRWLDLSLTSADNPNTPILAERMGAQVYKRYRVYRPWV